LHYGGIITLRTSTIPDNEKQYPGADAEHPTAPGITGKRVKPWRGAHQPPQHFSFSRSSSLIARLSKGGDDL
jgi:hypothetical protein